MLSGVFFNRASGSFTGLQVSFRGFQRRCSTSKGFRRVSKEFYRSFKRVSEDFHDVSRRFRAFQEVEEGS